MHKVAALAMLLIAPGTAAQAQEQAETRRAAYAVLADLPAIEGVWQADWGMVTRLRAAERAAPLTDAARAVVDQFNQAKAQGENLQTQGANCLPSGLPGSMRYPYPVEIFLAPGKVNIVIETHSQLRQIFTDGRPLPEDPDPLFNGSSVGRWEDGALVIETVGLTDRISILEAIHPTPQTRIQERIWLTEPGRMMIRTTITDPALFTEPFITELAYKLEPEWTLREYVCAENNRDAADDDGRPGMDLGLDAFDEPAPDQPATEDQTR